MQVKVLEVMKIKKFWNWIKNDDERTLFLNGVISDETWYGDEITPKLFKDELKTSIPRNELSHLMDEETWFNARKAVDLGFADKIMFAKDEKDKNLEGLAFSNMVAVNSILSKLPKKEKPPAGTSYKELSTRLNLIK